MQSHGFADAMRITVQNDLHSAWNSISHCASGVKNTRGVIALDDGLRHETHI